MNATYTLLLGLFIFIIFYILHSHNAQKATPLPIHRSFDPFVAFDVQLKNQLDPTSLLRQHARYGTTFQMTPMIAKPIVYTVAPENLKEIMTKGNDFGVEPLRGESMRPFCGRGFLTSDGDAWMESRRMVKPSFGKRNIEDLGALDSSIEELSGEIAKSGGSVDLQPLLFDMFLDNAFLFLLGTDGRDADTLSTGAPCSRTQFLKSFDSGLLGTGLRILLSELRFILPTGAYLKTCSTVHKWLEYYISEQMASHSNGYANGKTAKSSMAQSLATHTDDVEYIRGQILQSMLASKETTAVLISNAMFLLARNPGCWKRLREEVLAHPNKYELFTFDGMSSFSYLQHILKEALRLHPVFTLNGRIALRNTTLPTSPTPTDPNITRPHPAPILKGSTIVMSFYTLHRNEAVFGPDIEAFNPDRWLNINPTTYEYMPFGAGQRACLGREKSQAEAALVIARLAEKFETLESEDQRAFYAKQGISTCNGNGCRVKLT